MRRGRSASLVLACLSLACSSAAEPAAPGAAPPPVSPAPTAEPVAPEPLVPVPAGAAEVPTTAASRGGAAEEAASAYRALVRAFNQRDRAAYFGSFAHTLRCFYGRADVPRSELERTRLGEGETGVLVVFELDVVRQTTDEVVLLDRGFFSEDAGSARQVMHEKIVVLRREGRRFWVVAETSRAGLSCIAPALTTSAEPSARFDACRSAHRTCTARCSCDAPAATEGGCRGCMSACQAAAIECLGPGPPSSPGVPAAPEPSPAPGAPTGRLLATDADVRRFVTLTLAEMSALVATGEPELDEADERWLARASHETGRPLWQVADAEGPSGCGPFVVSRELAMSTELVGVDDVRCASDRSRCLAWVAVRDYERGDESLPVHLVFDGDRLRVAFVEAPRPRSALDATALDRFATAHPPGWDVPCQPALLGLVEDRVGSDFWEVTDVASAEFEAEDDAYDDEIAFHARRRCGAAARARVVRLGDDWSCDSMECSTWGMCGNWCASVWSDASGNVTASSEGIDAPVVTPAMLEGWRARVQCGASLPLSWDDVE